MRMYEIIEKKRDGSELSCAELEFFINGYCGGSIPDYQAAALLMAIFIRGMNSRETADLTGLMARSGDSIDLSAIPGIKVDKHSTGGVGDKTTLVLAPIVAACGVPVAKMSGRGLGHTGGTIDKLEAIKGFRTALTSREFIDNVREIGIAIAGQTGNLAPADKKLYALRDVTATVDSIPLIASSIMSKKLASGADRIVLDVKTGSGSFMKSLDDSIRLAREMVSIGERSGRKTVAVITDMDVPLGNAIGNSLEVLEAVDTLKGRGPADLETVSFELAARMLELAGLGSMEACRELVRSKVEDGSAFGKLCELVEKQGGLYRPDDGRLFERAAVVETVEAPRDGYIGRIKTDSLGVASLLLGAGRETKESLIDYSAGIILHKKTGMKVRKGEVLAELHTGNSDKLAAAGRELLSAISIAEDEPIRRPLILAYVDYEKVERYQAP
jgi:pyrimidine-nucleoside phosphorylase